MRPIVSLFVFAGFVVLTLAGCRTPAEVSRPVLEEEGDRVVGYHPWWMRDAWREYDVGLFDEIFFFSVEVDERGDIAERNGWPDRWLSFQEEISRRGTAVVPVVSLMDATAFRKLFSDENSISRLRENLLSLLEDSPNTGGLQLDFEVFRTVPEEVRSSFGEFVRELRSRMNEVRDGLSLSLFMLAYDEADVYDEAALAEEVDYFVVQGYDLHGPNEPRAGPVAALRGWGNRNWEHIEGRYRQLGVPKEKIVMSVPYFGYEWPTEDAEPGSRTRGRGSSITYAPVDTMYLRGERKSAVAQAAQYGVERDETSGSPYYVYEDSSGWHQGWFEDAESLASKYEYVRQQGLGGVALFPIGYGDAALEAVLRRHFGAE